MATTSSKPAQAREQSRADSIRKVTVASMTGTIIEWFDFNLFGAMAALVLGPLFFPSSNPVTSTLLSLATFGIAFVARPIGGAIFGHFGDRYGRKKTLVTALLLMGIGTFAIGLLPTYEQVGLVAPALLVACRLLQGIALGGEYGGAVLMVMEHKDAGKRRGLLSAWMGSTSPIGYILAAGLIALTSAFMPEQAFNSWGWRVPFLLSAALVAVGLYIRLQLEESDLFQEMAEEQAKVQRVRIPIVELFTKHAKSMFASIGGSVGLHAGYYLSVIFALSYVRSELDYPQTTSLLLVLIASVVYFAAIMISGHLSDRIGRRIPMITGLAGFAAWVFALFPLLQTRNLVLAGIGFSVALLFLGLLNGPIGSWLSELFPTEVRYTGLSFGYTVAGVLGGGLVPTLAVYLLDRTGSTVSVSVFAACVAAISCVVIARTRPGAAHDEALAEAS
ncbi:metabolite-proton symporter [Mycolicibacterium sp. BK556]|uniref:MFS transporter n=1 Tax=unclassified Mycolicibacterium TaxID=2636767 RepID=UPI00161B9F96|nr:MULTISPECIES: MFS transporter [unclassified Mycolicibacterium]MBB3607075.1 metabolite-proton symporter [Mycolicibacterium sp. BK556]MBB3636815.1 metabolite-proton symporter [Mycolicibacterium sp. BK607]